MKYQKLKKALILLADGTIFHGKAVGREGSAFGEVCFNTGMTGYQEIFTDPSYYGQLMVTTNAHIGNYGVKNEENESNSVKIAGLICKNFSYEFSRDAADGSLEDFLNKNSYLKVKDNPSREVLSLIHVQDVTTADATGGEPVFLPDGTPVGRVTSGTYGYSVDMSLALGYLKDTPAGTLVDVMILGVPHRGVVLAEPPFDSKGERLRA